MDLETERISDNWLLTKSVLRKMIDEDRWDEIGRRFNFVPRFRSYRNKTYFDWSSAPAAMMDVVGWIGSPPAHSIRKFKYKLSPEPSGVHAGDDRSGKKMINRLFESQGGKCYYCGASTEHRQRSKDHKLPRSRGGNHIENYVGACKPCNGAKGSMTFEEFLQCDYLDNDRRLALGFGSPPLKAWKQAQRDAAIALAHRSVACVTSC